MRALAISLQLVTLVALGLPAAAGERKPNFVIILADDLGWRDLACTGGELCDTPRLDRLAAEGMRFTSAYAPAPICSASRVAILTGRSPARLHFEFVTKPPGVNPPVRRLQPPPYTRHLPLEEVTISEILQQAGYATGFFGKWHVSEHHGRYLGWSPTRGPRQQGFEHAIEDFGSHPYGTGKHIPDAGTYTAGKYPRDAVTDHAIDFLEAHREEPFFLFLSHYFVHTPVRAPTAWLLEKYRAKADETIGPAEKRAHYGAVVETLDHYVGDVLDALDRLEIDDRTVVIFTSDNGGHPEYSANGPLRGSKWNLYEGGIRVPLLVRWPGVTPPGSVCREPVVGTDLLPTVCQITGAPLPSGPLDGKSLLPLLTRQSGAWPTRGLLWHFPYYHPERGYRSTLVKIGINDFAVSQTHPHSALRYGNFKILRDYDTGQIELYDLSRDPGESHNLRDSHPEVRDDLLRRLDEALAEADARLPDRPPR